MGTAKTLTEKPSVKPNDLRKRADSVTESVNAMLPSPVFWFDADHRFRPSRLPTTDAYQEKLSGGWGWIAGKVRPPHAGSTRGRGALLTRASPTPNAKSPVKWSNCDGLGKCTSAKPGTPSRRGTRTLPDFGGLTLQTTQSWHIQ